MKKLGDILIIAGKRTGDQVEVIVTQVFGDDWYQVTATATGETSLIMMLGAEHVVTDPDAIEAAKATMRAARQAFDSAILAAESLAAFGLTAEQIGTPNHAVEIEAHYERLRNSRRGRREGLTS